MAQPSKFPTPGPESRFFVAPASDKTLRRTRVTLFLTPVLMLIAVIVGTLSKDWYAMAFGLVVLCIFGVLRWFQFRVIARELSRRRQAHRHDS